MNTPWWQHSVTLEGDIVKKTPLPWCVVDFQKAQVSVEFFKKKFWEIVPETTVSYSPETWYVVSQKFIEWKQLSEMKVEDISYKQLQDFLRFIDTCIFMLFYEGKYFDIIGFQRDTPFETISWEWFIQRLSRHFQVVKNFFSSSNFILSPTGTIHFVDNIANYGIYDTNRNKNIPMQCYRMWLLLRYRTQILQAMWAKGVT